MSPVGAHLVVNADDFGLTPGVCTGILHAHEHGIVTSTSVLTAAPAFATHVGALRDSGMGVGVHLCLVGEDPPLLSAREVPSLVDSRGHLSAGWPQFVSRVARGQIDLDDVERELMAQVHAAEASGLSVGHLDGHQHLHLLPGVSDVVLGVAQRFEVPAIRVVDTRSLRLPIALVRPLAARLRRRARRAGILVPDTAAGLDTAGRLDALALARSISLLSGRDGVADLTTHPGGDPDPDRSRYRWGYRWTDELDALCAPQARRAVERAGFTLTNYARLAQVARG